MTERFRSSIPILWLLGVLLTACAGSAATNTSLVVATAPHGVTAAVTVPATATSAPKECGAGPCLAPPATVAATATLEPKECGAGPCLAPPATVAAAQTAAAQRAGNTPAPTGTVISAGSMLFVFAAASLTESFTEIKTAFEKANPGVTVTYNFGGSPTLVTQLTQGAPADVFASADQPNMDNAIKGGVIAGTPQIFAKNKLVIILPKDNKAGIMTPKDLAKPGIKIDTAQESVPVAAYTQTALDNFSKLPDYGADFKANVNKNVVSKEDNVKAIVQKVQLGEVDAGIVYTTDAQAAADKLTMIAIPDGQNVIATYPIAVVKGAKQATLGQKFVDYVLSPAGQAVLQKYGFAPGR